MTGALLGALREVLDLIQPRAFARALLRGSGILLRLILRGLLTALKRAVSRPAVPPAKPSGKTQLKKADATEDEDGEDGEDGQEVRKEKPQAEARPAGSLADQLGMGILVLAVAGGALSIVAGALVNLLRPYAGILASVVALGWIVAALTADAVTRTGNDQEKDLGEQPQEDDPEADGEEEESETDPWPRQRELLRIFVEHRVTAVALNRVDAIKGKGARVDDLLSEQQENGGLIGLDRKGMTALLAKAGITVRDQMKFRVMEDSETGAVWKQKNVPGVHMDDLRKDLGRTPRLPPSLVTDYTPVSPPEITPVSVAEMAPSPAQESPRIPASRQAAG